MSEISRIYSRRFGDIGAEKRNRVWRILCRFFFDARMVAGGSILELACGYGEFLNNIDVRQKYAVDINKDCVDHLSEDITFFRASADRLELLGDNTLDRVFTSNFLEHLPDKETCSRVFAEVFRVLKPGGKFIVMGPNIRYLYAEYWDFYDHHLALSHVSVREGLAINGFDVEEVIDRFLPYSMQSRLPSGDLLIKIYISLPMIWRFFGKQFLITGRKPESGCPAT